MIYNFISLLEIYGRNTTIYSAFITPAVIEPVRKRPKANFRFNIS